MPHGRNRKPGPRHPGGKLKSAPIIRPDPPHRRGYGSDPRAATLHGRLYLDGVITGPQYVAGELYLVTLAKYRAAILAPGGLRSRGEGYAGRRMELDEDHDADLIERVAALMRIMRRTRRPLEAVLCDEIRPDDPHMYRAGLSILVGVYGL